MSKLEQNWSDLEASERESEAVQQQQQQQQQQQREIG